MSVITMILTGPESAARVRAGAPTENKMATITASDVERRKNFTRYPFVRNAAAPKVLGKDDDSVRHPRFPHRGAWSEAFCLDSGRFALAQDLDASSAAVAVSIGLATAFAQGDDDDVKDRNDKEVEDRREDHAAE